MEKKDILLIIIAFLGWTWGIIQYSFNRHHQKKDKLIDRKYEAYSSYMKKADELMKNIRTDPKMIYGIPSKFIQSVLTGDEQQANNALIKFNEELLDFVQKASEPLMILNQELNSLLLICSEDLASNICEFNLLATDFNNEIQKSLSLISANDSDNMIRHLQTLGHNDRWVKLEDLN